MIVSRLRCVGRFVLCLIAVVALISCSDDPASSEPPEYSHVRPDVVQILLPVNGDTAYQVDAPIEGVLRFDLQAAIVARPTAAQHMRIIHHTENEYSWYNCAVVMDIHTGVGTITCYLKGVDYPVVTQDAFGPATQRTEFRMEPGTYLLRYVRGDEIDRYKVTLDDRHIEVETLHSSFTAPWNIYSFPR